MVWDKVRNNPLYFIAVAVVGIAASVMALGSLYNWLPVESNIESLVSMLKITIMSTIVLAVGIFYLYLRITDKEEEKK